jgi:hypothetical protein
MKDYLIMTVGHSRNVFVPQRQRRGAALLFRAVESLASSCGADHTSLAISFVNRMRNTSDP